MRNVLNLCLPWLASTLAAGDAEVERARPLIDALLSQTYLSTSYREDSVQASELLELSKDSGVRKLVHERLEDYYIRRKRGFSYHHERLYMLLLLSGPTAKEVDLLASIAEARPGAVDLAALAEALLARAPFSLSPRIDASLLDRVTGEAARTLDPEYAPAVWLAAGRFSPERLEASMTAAWKKAHPRRFEPDTKRYVFGEITVKDPEGKRVEEAFVANRSSRVFPSAAILWPDGKIRIRKYAKEGEDFELRLTVPGYYDPEPKPFPLSGPVRRTTVTLAKRRHVVRGKLAFTPTAPLFLRVWHDRPLGTGGGRYLGRDGEFVAAVRPDGSFEVPYTRRSNARELQVFDVDGNFVAIARCPLPSEGGDIDLEPVERLAGNTFFSVPVRLNWPSHYPRPDVPVGARIQWRSTANPSLRGGMYAGFSDWALLSQKRVLPFTVARNLPAGPYAVSFEFERRTPKLVKLEVEYVVGPASEALVITPELVEPPELATPEKPTHTHPVIGRGSVFQLKTGPSEAVILLSASGEQILFKSHRGASRVVEPGRVIDTVPASTGLACKDLDFSLDREGNVHVFTLLASEDFRQSVVRHARLSAAGELRGEWIDFTGATGATHHYKLPAVDVSPGDGIGIFSVDHELAGASSTRFLASGRLQAGRYTGSSRQSLEKTSLKNAIMHSRIVCSGDGKAAILYTDRGRFYWADLETLKRRAATPSIPHADFATIHHTELLLVGDTLHVAAGLAASRNSGYLKNLWLGEGGIGKPLRRKALLKDVGPGDGCALARSPAGEVYLFASHLEASGERHQRDQLAYWMLSGRGSPSATPSPWIVRNPKRLRAAFSDERTAHIVWGNDQGLYSRVVILQE